MNFIENELDKPQFYFCRADMQKLRYSYKIFNPNFFAVISVQFPGISLMKGLNPTKGFIRFLLPVFVG